MDLRNRARTGTRQTMTKKKSTSWVLLVGSTVHNPDVRYATGMSVPDPIVVMRRGREQHIVVPHMEFNRAQRESQRQGAHNTTVYTPAMLKIRPGRHVSRLGQWASVLLRRMSVRQVQVAWDFPHSIAEQLKRKGVRVCSAKGELIPERKVKRADELQKIRESQQAAVIAMRAAIAAISAARIDAAGYLRMGGRRLTSEDVRNTITDVLVAHGCICADTIVACGKDAVDPHEKGSGELRAGETIVLDIFPQHLEHGYWGDLTRTVVRGKADRQVKKMYAAVKAAQAAALNAIRPGVKGETVHRRAVEEIARRGFKTVLSAEEARGFIHGTGHGVGLAIHESPSLARGTDWLKSGNVVTVEPGLYYPEIGGIRIEDTVVVTPGGWRYLVPCEKRLEV